MVGVISEIKGKLSIAINFVQYQNCWISDIAWMDILKYNLRCNVTKKNLKTAFTRLTPITPSWKVESNERNFKIKSVPRVVIFIILILVPIQIKISPNSNG